MRRLAGLLALLLCARLAASADPPELFLTLQVEAPLPPGQIAEGLPPRLTLYEDGTVFVGGTDRLATGRLEGAELKEIEKRLDRIRKMTRLDAPITFGPGTTRYRLVVRKGRPLDVTATGDLQAAAPALKAFAALVSDLAGFHHRSLRPYQPTSYALRAFERELPGGCRYWSFPVTPAEALAAPRALPASEAAGWPAGAVAASACADDKRYAVTLRPLLPGEKP